MDTREELPRISFENAQSWQRLETSYRQAVLQRLQDEIAGSGVADERGELQAHMLRFIDQTLESAQRNLRVNGQPYGHLDDSQYEPFDEALDRRIWSLADTRMQWFKRIAETRRKLPQELAAELAATTEENQVFEVRSGSDTQMPEPDVFGTWQQKDNYHIVIQQLTALGDELCQILPEQCHRAERTKAVAADIKTHKL